MASFDLSRVLITGGGGYIGCSIGWGTKLSREELDISDPTKLNSILSRNKWTAVLNLSAIDIRRCQTQPFKAIEVNALAPLSLAKATEALQIPLVLLSTGAIFSGSFDQEFSTEDTPNPQNIYGQTKWMMELLCRPYSHVAIVRTGWVFGSTQATTPRFIDKAKVNALSGEPIHASDDQRGSPTYVRDLIQTIEMVLKHKQSGLIHGVNSGSATAFEMSQFIKEHLRSQSTVIKTTAITSASEIRRSPSEVLVPSDFLKPRSWQDALVDFLESK